MVYSGCNVPLDISKIPPTRRDLEKCKKAAKDGIRNILVFSCLLREWQGVLGSFLVGAVLPLPVMKLGSGKLEVSPPRGKNNTGVVLVSHHK